MMTPYIRYRQSQIEENCATIRRTVLQAGAEWAPFLSRNLPPSILQEVASMTESASCRVIDDAESLATQGFKSLILTRPIVDPLALGKLRDLAGRVSITVLIDHFRHAELLSQNLSENALIQVLIAVDAGRQSIGVRPGPDSVLLAKGAQKLRGIQLRGVFIEDGCQSFSRLRDAHRGHHFGDERSDNSFEEAIAIAKHCQRMLDASGIPRLDLVTGLNRSASTVVADGVTTWLASPVHSTEAPVAEIVCRVISRPTLESCVVDLGSCLLSSIHNTPEFHPAGARLLHCRSDECTLSLSGPSLDLRIGDEVIVTSSPCATYPGLQINE